MQYNSNNNKHNFNLNGTFDVTKTIKLNYAATAQLTYDIVKGFGIMADGTIATRYPRISDYAGTGPTAEQ